MLRPPAADGVCLRQFSIFRSLETYHHESSSLFPLIVAFPAGALPAASPQPTSRQHGGSAAKAARAPRFVAESSTPCRPAVRRAISTGLFIEVHNSEALFARCPACCAATSPRRPLRRARRTSCFWGASSVVARGHLDVERQLAGVEFLVQLGHISLEPGPSLACARRGPTRRAASPGILVVQGLGHGDGRVAELPGSSRLAVICS